MAISIKFLVFYTSEIYTGVMVAVEVTFFTKIQLD